MSGRINSNKLSDRPLVEVSLLKNEEPIIHYVVVGCDRLCHFFRAKRHPSTWISWDKTNPQTTPINALPRLNSMSLLQIYNVRRLLFLALPLLRRLVSSATAGVTTSLASLVTALLPVDSLASLRMCFSSVGLTNR